MQYQRRPFKIGLNLSDARSFFLRKGRVSDRPIPGLTETELNRLLYAPARAVDKSFHAFHRLVL